METISAVELSIAANVRIVEGATQYVAVTGPEETVNQITKSVNSGKWKIGFPTDYNSNYDKLDITITSSIIKKLGISGSGNIIGVDTLYLSDIQISGSGSIEVKTISTSLYSDISASGNISVSGTVGLLKHSVSGSGKLYAFNLMATDAEINASGSGNTEIYVISNLHAEIDGSGNIYYKGAPSITQEINGSGSLINSN